MRCKFSLASDRQSCTMRGKLCAVKMGSWSIRITKGVIEMKLDEVTSTKAIVERYFERLMDNLDIDVAIVGGGPSGLVLIFLS